MSRTDIWMPFYVADYLTDTMRLNTLQHGAYVLLLMEYWRNGPLPDSDDELAAIARMERKRWDKDARAAIRRFFVLQPDGLLHQKRADLERQKAIDLSNKRRSAALSRGSKVTADDGPSGEQMDGGGGAIEPDLPSKGGAFAAAIAPPIAQQLYMLPRATITLTGQKKERKKENPPSPQAGRSRAKACLADAEFAEFYERYPRHDAPDDALKAWRQVIKAGAQPADIIAGLANYRFVDNPRFVRLPAGWLRGGCWKSAGDDGFDPVLRAAGLQPEDFDDMTQPPPGLLQ